MALRQHEYAPLVVTLMLVIQFKAPRVTLPKIDDERLPGAQQYQKDLAESYLVPWTEKRPTINQPVLRVK
jgi:hypothetical protein